MMRIARLLAFPLAALTSSAFGADGQIDLLIDPNAGATISASGSYVVVENVDMTADVPGIQVNASDVAIDFGGHTMRGVARSTQAGISAVVSDHLRLANGVIRDFGLNGVTVNQHAKIEGIVVEGCANWGIQAGAHSVISNCEANRNNSAGDFGGIKAGDDSMVVNCQVAENSPAASGGFYGILVGFHSRAEGNICKNHATPSGGGAGLSGDYQCIFVGNVVSAMTSAGGNNAVFGVRCQDESVVRGNTVSYVSGPNFVFGLSVGNSSSVENNVVDYNTATLTNPIYGISTGYESVVRGNASNYNSHTGSGYCWGIYAGGNSVIENNVASSNSEGTSSAATVYGIQAAGGSVIRGNTCSNNHAGGSDGTVRGITIYGTCLISGNTCASNQAAGTGDAAGIEEGGSGGRITGNICNSQAGGTKSHGILISGSGNYVSDNFCQANGTAGLLFTTGVNNRSELNRFRQSVGIDTSNGVSPASLGGGTLTDLTF